MMEWHPIETAPKDGSCIDLWISGEDYESGGWRWTDVCWTDDGWSDEFNCLTDLGNRMSDATHWRPRPAPPLKP